MLKEHAWIGPEATPLGDRKNTAHAWSVVARGRGCGVVVATGGVFYPGTGDPPPSAQVIAISEQLAAFATLVEDYLNTRK